METKICRQCGKENEISDFVKNKDAKDGYSNICKQCKRDNWDRDKDEINKNRREWRKENYDKYREYRVGYTSKNIDRLLEVARKYKADHSEELSVKNKQSSCSSVLYKTYGHQLTIIENPIEDEDGIMLCQCKFCEEYFYPTRMEVGHRIQALKGNKSGEASLYCSEEHKYMCDTYNAQMVPKSLRTYNGKARCHQKINRRALLDLQIDECGYNYCEKCGERFFTEDLALHHNIMVSLQPGMADDMSHQLLLCKKCHEHKGCN